MEFDFEKLVAGIQKKTSYELLHGQVIYDHKEQVAIIEKTIENEIIRHAPGFEYLNSWEELDNLTDENIEDLYVWLSVLIDAYNMFFKLDCFKGENEYRMVFCCIHDGGRVNDDGREEQYFRIKNEVMIPFVKKRLVSLEALESVMIGPKNKSDIAEKGLQYFFRNRKMDVKIHKSQMPIRY